MLDHLEDISVAAKRNGSADGIEVLEHDLEMGWVFKLLAQFGLRRELTLEDECSSMAFGYLASARSAALRSSLIWPGYQSSAGVGSRPVLPAVCQPRTEAA